jgi:single-stranded DNA-binding protein
MTTNEKNYPGATVTLVGWVSGPARNPAYDKEGKKGVKEIGIPINEGYPDGNGGFTKTGTTWYTVSAAGDYANELLALAKGDKVRIEDAKQEVREYTDKEGNAKLGITLKFGKVIVLEHSGADSPADRASDAPAAAASSDDGW